MSGACDPALEAKNYAKIAIDLDHDGNVFSFCYPSRLDIGLADGGRFDCEDMRPGCAGIVSDDGWPGDYSYIEIVTSPDG